MVIFEQLPFDGSAVRITKEDEGFMIEAGAVTSRASISNLPSSQEFPCAVIRVMTTTVVQATSPFGKCP